VEDKDIVDNTPLHLASQNGSLAIVKFLVEKGAQINARGNNGKTALHLAARDGYVLVVEFLEKHGGQGSIFTKFHFGRKLSG
jgi:ankyrin repeat protein